MQINTIRTARLAGALALAVLLCLPGGAFAQSDHVSVQGHVTSIGGQGAIYRVTLDNGATYAIPRSMIVSRNIHVGDLVRLDGTSSAGVVNVNDAFLITTPPVTTAAPMSGVAPNTLSGVVQNINRDLSYVTIRDQATGQSIKIDTRRMDSARSLDPWRLRAGDRVMVSGRWENRDTFEANVLNFPAYLPMATASANSLNGIVQTLNRNLNYVTVRDQATGRNVKIDVRGMDERQSVNVWQLHAGDPVAVSGKWSNRNTFRASRVNFAAYPPMTSATGTLNLVTGVVDSVNRDLNYVTIRNDATGQLVKIDVRQMDTRQSVNVWHLRAGDRIVVSGGWEKGDTFRATTVNF